MPTKAVRDQLEILGINEKHIEIRTLLTEDFSHL